MIQKVELDFPFKQKKPFSAARQLILPGAMSSCTDAVQQRSQEARRLVGELSLVTARGHYLWCRRGPRKARRLAAPSSSAIATASCIMPSGGSRSRLIHTSAKSSGGVGTVARDEIGESDAPTHSSSVVTAPVPCSVRGSDTNRAVPGNGSWRADAPPAACPQEADRDAVSSDAFGIACPYASADTRGVRQAAVAHNSSYLRIA